MKSLVHGIKIYECVIILSHDSHLLLRSNLVRCLTTVELNNVFA